MPPPIVRKAPAGNRGSPKDLPAAGKRGGHSSTLPSPKPQASARAARYQARQVFYQATVLGVVEKSEAGYTKVQTDLVKMRRAGALPYDWLADNTRWQRKPETFESIEEALQETQNSIARRFGRTPTLTLRSGWKRMP
jgi:hypothetical protein